MKYLKKFEGTGDDLEYHKLLVKDIFQSLIDDWNIYDLANFDIAEDDSNYYFNIWVDDKEYCILYCDG